MAKQREYPRGTSPNDFSPGIGRLNAKDGKFKKYSGQYEAHATIESMPEPKRAIREFHISVYYYPNYTDVGQWSLEPKQKQALWNWRYTSATETYTYSAQRGNHVVPPSVMQKARAMAQNMKGVCFSQGGTVQAIP